MYDLIILGGGPGGYDLAYKASKKGIKTLLIEANRIGGTCVTVGCIPSKAFLHAEKVYSEAINGKNIGINLKEITFNQKQLLKYKNEKVDFLVKATENKIKRAGAKIVYGYGKILPESKANDFIVEANEEKYQGKNLVIATGSKVFFPPIKGLDKKENKSIIDSTDALELPEIPKDILIMGAGVIGLELGTFFAGVGSKITMVEMNSKVAGPFDNEASTMLQNELTNKKKIKFLLSHQVIEIKQNEAIILDKDKKKIKLKFSKILVATGRVANIKGFGLENLMVFIERNAIVTDENLKTNIPGLFAIGDVNGKSMLAHTAYREGEIVLDSLMGNHESIDYEKIPSVIYSTPEVAEIGINEEEAKKQGIEVLIKKLPMLYSGRFVIENDDFDGLIKFVIKKSTNEIIGLTMVGSYASELMTAGSILIGKRFNKEKLADVTFAHPTVGEILKDALFL